LNRYCSPEEPTIDAEIRAIIEAIALNQHLSEPIMICTDSMSSMMAAQNRNTRETNTIQLANLLYNGMERIKLLWTPGHVGIDGDESAKAALNLSLDRREKIAELDLAYHVRNTIIPKKGEILWVIQKTTSGSITSYHGIHKTYT
jgi:hypothetical protein